MELLAPLDVGLLTGLIYALPVIALALAFRVLAFPDITIEGSFPLGAATFGILVKSGVSAPLAALAGVTAGALVGALTAFLHTRFRINKLLAGIIVVAITYTLSLRVMGSSNVGLIGQPSIFNLVSAWDGFVGGNLHAGTLLLLAAIVAIVCSLAIVGLSTRLGLRLRAAGANPAYARLLGIHVPINLICGLAITNGIAALGGVLAAMNQGFADVGMGQGILIMALAALTIGERLLPSKRLSYQTFILLAALCGATIYQLLVSFALRLGLAATDLKLATAVLVLLVIALRATKDGQLFLEDLK